MTFADLNLHKALLQALDDLEYLQPTPIQVQAFPLVMAGRDVIGIAQTGTGKTFAYLLPLLRLLKFSKEGQPRILIIVPTRELVLQVVQAVEQLIPYLTVRVAGVYGGTGMSTQKQRLQEGTDIVVATPGRLLDLAYTGVLRLKAVKKLVIDEVDEMLHLGFRTQLNNVLDLLPPKRQHLLFSATMTEEVEQLVQTYFNQPEKIEIASSGTPIEKINQRAYHVPNFNTKVNLLQQLLNADETMNKVLVFVGTKRLADRLFEQLTAKAIDQVGIIHGNKSQNFRVKSVQDFQQGVHRVLIATDIIARGLDISEVSHVVNFDLPEVPENYIHRIGRTGRADQAGQAIAMITEIEQEYQMAIEKLMKQNIEVWPLPENLVISDTLIPEEIPRKAGDINYLGATQIEQTQGAFHEKKEKNKKVNRAKEKRMARMREKQKARRRKKPRKR
ncbi:MAG: DEAD/DEAH box helicase [Bacteroidota bacterium]